MNHEQVIKKSIISLGALGFAAVTLSSQAFTGENYVKDAKITMQEARTIALKAYRGKIVTEELELENGGSGLRYSFDIRRDKVTQEVGVDAKTGKVLENDPEGPNHD